LRRIIADSFYEKADLESWLKPKVPYSDYTDILEALWEPLLEKNLRLDRRAVFGEYVG